MKIDRRLTLIGIMLVVLSMTMATQYATTKIGYSYNIVHPSMAEIRFIGSDNASDGIRVLRVDGDNGTHAKIKLVFGNLSANQNKTYSAAFGIVNEELFAVNITHINLSMDAGCPDYMQIWLHGDRDAIANSSGVGGVSDSSSVFMWSKNTSMNPSSTTAWVLARGDQNYNTMTSNCSTASAAGTNITTIWDETAHVQYSISNVDARQADKSDSDHSLNNASDFVWVQISIDIPSDPTGLDAITGTMWIHFQATTQYGED